MSEIDKSFKDIKIISGVLKKCYNINTADEKNMLYINNWEDYSNYYYYKLLNQQLYSLEEVIKTKQQAFTYILFQVKENNTPIYGFAARPIYSSFELYAKHESIYKLIVENLFGIKQLEWFEKQINLGNQYRTDYPGLEVVFSGEILMESPTKMRYNFNSGTFMEHRFKKIDDKTLKYYGLTFDGLINNLGFNHRTFFYNATDKITHLSDHEPEFEKIISKLPNIEYAFLTEHECDLVTNINYNFRKFQNVINRMIAINNLQNRKPGVKLGKNDRFIKPEDVFQNKEAQKRVKDYNIIQKLEEQHSNIIEHMKKFEQGVEIYEKYFKNKYTGKDSSVLQGGNKYTRKYRRTKSKRKNNKKN